MGDSVGLVRALGNSSCGIELTKGLTLSLLPLASALFWGEQVRVGAFGSGAHYLFCPRPRYRGVGCGQTAVGLP
jgi:hypothetical protein